MNRTALMGCLLIVGVRVASSQTATPAEHTPIVSEPGPGGVRVTDHGLLGNFYPRMKAGVGPAILLLGGSEGGLGGVRSAQALVAQGYSVFSLAYFGDPGLPQHLRLVPLEYSPRP